jgi:hypothetical protein
VKLPLIGRKQALEAFEQRLEAPAINAIDPNRPSLV